jgi:toxin ParE1/3/4
VSGRVRKRPRAVADLVEHAEFIKNNTSATMAARFLVAAESTFGRLAEMPEMGRPFLARRRRLAGVRVFPVRAFRKHLVFYRPLARERGVEVIRVLHAARDINAVLGEK